MKAEAREAEEHQAVRSRMASESDVVIVGAGISGLCSAKLLKEAGLNVVVLEARDRVGGRTLTKRDPAVGYVDLGGAYVGPTQNRIFRIAKELGVQNYKVNEVEDLAHHNCGRTRRFRDAPLPRPCNPLLSLDMNNFFRILDEMGKEIPADAPWDAPHADEWDTMTYKDFVDKVCWTKAMRKFANLFISLNVTSEGYESSLLWFLWYVKQCGGTKRIVSTTNGGQERKFRGGSQQVSEKLAERLGDSVHKSKPVVGITQDDNGVVVRTLDGSEYKAKYVILAMPPPLHMKIHYEPPLPPLRNQLIQRMPMGTVLKCMIYYKRAYWKEKGFCGSLIIEGLDDHPVSFTLDDTKPDGSYPALMGFVLGDKHRRTVSLSKEERRNRIAQSFAKVLDCEEMLHPVHYEEYNWMAEQYSGGCYTTMCPPGLLTRYGRVLREPIGRMYFAGTETATQWSGYMEGAVQAGERAAREILHAMGRIPKEQIWKDEPPCEDVPVRPFPSTFLERNLPSVPGLFKFMKISSFLLLGSFLAYKRFKHCH